MDIVETSVWRESTSIYVNHSLVSGLLLLREAINLSENSVTQTSTKEHFGDVQQVLRQMTLIRLVWWATCRNESKVHFPFWSVLQVSLLVTWHSSSCLDGSKSFSIKPVYASLFALLMAHHLWRSKWCLSSAGILIFKVFLKLNKLTQSMRTIVTLIFEMHPCKEKNRTWKGIKKDRHIFSIHAEWMVLIC